MTPVVLTECSKVVLRSEIGPKKAVPSINLSYMRWANRLQPGWFGRLHVGRFEGQRRLLLTDRRLIKFGAAVEQ